MVVAFGPGWVKRTLLIADFWPEIIGEPYSKSTS